jgi:hypothetical protein
MNLRRTYDRTMDWCAGWLPAPTPIGLRVFGYQVTKLDLALQVGALLIALAAVAWYGSWVWFPIALLLFVMMWIWMWPR